MKKLLEITLLSDLCVSEGGAYNSMLDTDICYDDYGFPYIPARRLRGCLRECALELADWGAKIDPDTLFGKPSEQSAKVRLGNAVIQDAEKYKTLINEMTGHPFLHRQNVLNMYSYIRTQTAISPVTGSADPTSLRTMRVARKGLVFRSQVDLSDSSLYEQLEMCCNVLSHMGIARTRGFGEVSAKLKAVEEDQSTSEAKETDIKLVPDADSLTIRIDLLEPLVAKSHDGGEAKTMDYIEGAKILGLIVQRLKGSKVSFVDFMSQGKLTCSNAYLTIDKKRSSEVPACFYEIKNNDEEYINRLYEDNASGNLHTEEQLSQMRHSYVVLQEDGSITKKDVEIQQRYHHTRPADKSIGRASAAEPDSIFYQISSICEGQSFTGIIRGSSSQIKTVYEMFTAEPEAFMGYARTSEYGLVRINVTASEKSRPSVRTSGRKFAFILRAPAIVYNEKAFYSTDSNDLISEIIAAICRDKKETDILKAEKYLKYTDLGGFNVTWGMRKPSVKAFGAGSVVVIQFKEDTEVTIPEALFIGERNAEGFGEAEILLLDHKKAAARCGIIKDGSGPGNGTLDVSGFGIAKDICDDKLSAYIREKAILDAESFFRSVSLRPVVSNMLLMHEENSTVAGIRSAVESRFGKSLQSKQKKKEIAKEILERTEKGTKSILNDFCRDFGIQGYEKDIEWIRMQYLKDFLVHGKYRIRQIGQ